MKWPLRLPMLGWVILVGWFPQTSWAPGHTQPAVTHTPALLLPKAPALTPSRGTRQLLYNYPPPPSSSVSPWNFLQGPLESRFFSLLFVPCSFRNTALWARACTGQPCTLWASAVSSAFLMHILGMQIFANAKCSLTLWIQFIFVEIRESGNVTQWWHYSNTEHSETRWNTVSCVFSFSAASWWEEEHRLETHSKCLSFPCTFSKARNMYQKEAGDFPFLF